MSAYPEEVRRLVEALLVYRDSPFGLAPSILAALEPLLRDCETCEGRRYAGYGIPRQPCSNPDCIDGKTIA